MLTFDLQETNEPGTLGMWKTSDAPPLSFEPGAAKVDQVVWRINLGSNPLEDLARREKHLKQTARGLQTAESRLTTMTRSLKSGSSGTSFDVSQSTQLAQPERELLLWLQDPNQSAVSFDQGSNVGAGLQQANIQFQEFASRLSQVLTTLARVETNVGGKLLGSTIVSWTGTMDTAWRAESVEQASVHFDALTLVLNSRVMWIRMLALTSRGAFMLATLPAMLAAPEGALVALPAMWKFINDILAEVAQSQVIQTPTATS